MCLYGWYVLHNCSVEWLIVGMVHKLLPLHLASFVDYSDFSSCEP